MAMKMKQKVALLIKAFVRDYRSVRYPRIRWEEPLVAFARAQDPLFRQLKELVSPTHALPTDFLPDAQTVITFFLPFQEAVNLENLEGKASAASWAVAYLETNRLIMDLSSYLAKKLQETNYQAAQLPPTHNFDQNKLVSDWSHKHVAYIAGLGKFGLHQMLITEKGCSGRLGSIITNLEIEPSPRPEGEFCLYKQNRSCAQCVRQCVSGALQLDSYNRHSCYERLLQNAAQYASLGFADVCGKCASNVPCAFTNPCRP